MIETIVLVLGVLILGAFALRVIIESLDVIYKIAPWIIICVVAAALMYMFANDDYQKILDMKEQNATITRTAED
jgi:nitrate/nitrite transporter NarK